MPQVDHCLSKLLEEKKLIMLLYIKQDVEEKYGQLSLSILLADPYRCSEP